MSKIGFIAAGLLIASTGIASAHSSVDARQAAQKQQIEAGRQSGRITYIEGLKLRAEQKRIARTEAKFRSNGYLSRSERAELRDQQNEAAKHIKYEKQDGWKRAWWLPRVGR